MAEPELHVKSSPASHRTAAWSSTVLVLLSPCIYLISIYYFLESCHLYFFKKKSCPTSGFLKECVLKHQQSIGKLYKVRTY